MKRTRLAHSRTRKLMQLPMLLLLAISLATGCDKEDKDPCRDLLNEGMPTQVAFKFLDKQTGENLLLTRNIDTAGVTISPLPIDAGAKRGVIVKQANHPMEGCLVFTVSEAVEGPVNYKIDIEGIGATNVSYNNKREAGDSPCRPFVIRIKDMQVTDHEFTLDRTTFRYVFTIRL
ncbi:hypothetical protein MKQ68_11415 [Chitinophaga horti]|uniref:Lipoprotein n=1 Tax=Chitinophaga horti TaxID=2920382 RepID=A0ABY6J8A3_9BACT|nr:hypothetical protein [Chitinophaga horti]UYQ95710.1 hypothetical protein MKQ68_11415 [Chitinophaga horti]